MFKTALSLARSISSSKLESAALFALGTAAKESNDLVKAFDYFQKEASLRGGKGDEKSDDEKSVDDEDRGFGLFRIYGSLGEIFLSLGSPERALEQFESQLRVSAESLRRNAFAEAVAFRNLATARLELGQLRRSALLLQRDHHDALLDRCVGSSSRVAAERVRGLLVLSEIQEMTEDFKDMKSTLERCLELATRPEDQDLVLRGLGTANKALGHHAVAIAWYEKRLVLAYTAQPKSRALKTAYGELGLLHSIVGRSDKAVSCLLHQLALEKETGDVLGQCQALCALGSVFQGSEDLDRAKMYFEEEFGVIEGFDPDSPMTISLKARCFGNLGLTAERMMLLDSAIAWQERHLALANESEDEIAKGSALRALTRCWTKLRDFDQALDYVDDLSRLPSPLNRGALDELLKGFVLWEMAMLSEWDEATVKECLESLSSGSETVEKLLRANGASSVMEESFIPCFMRKQAESQLALAYEVLQCLHWRRGLFGKSLLFAEKALALKGRKCDSGEAQLLPEESLNPLTAQLKGAILHHSIADGKLYSYLLIDGEIVANEEKTLFDTFSEGIFGKRKTFRDYLSDLNLDELAVSATAASTNGASSSTPASPSYVNEVILRNHQTSSSSFSSEIQPVKPPLFASQPVVNFLHQLLIGPFQSRLAEFTSRFSRESSSSSSLTPSLTIVVEESLSTVPFPVLRSSKDDDFLFQRFDLKVTSCLSNFLREKVSFEARKLPSLPVLAVGNPLLNEEERTAFGVKDLPLAAKEAKWVAEFFNQRHFVGKAL